MTGLKSTDEISWQAYFSDMLKSLEKSNAKSGLVLEDSSLLIHKPMNHTTIFAAEHFENHLVLFIDPLSDSRESCLEHEKLGQEPEVRRWIGRITEYTSVKQKLMGIVELIKITPLKLDWKAKKRKKHRRLILISQGDCAYSILHHLLLLRYRAIQLHLPQGIEYLGTTSHGHTAVLSFPNFVRANMIYAFKTYAHLITST